MSCCGRDGLGGGAPNSRSNEEPSICKISSQLLAQVVSDKQINSLCCASGNIPNMYIFIFNMGGGRMKENALKSNPTVKCIVV